MLADHLRHIIANLGSVGVAFSGGADSALLLALCRDVLGPERVLALTVLSELTPTAEREWAAQLAHTLGVRHIEVPFPALAHPEIVANRPDFLRRTVPCFLSDARVGIVQTRWSHINGEYSLLTRAQALALDGHFVVEQTARSTAGLLMHFNGTAGVWRRACIEAGGGWQSDTVCEDLDLSYRAQLAGWRFIYLEEVDSPAELPPQMLAFKQQQARWAQGSVQVLRKLARPLVRSRLGLARSLLGLAHLSGYLVHPLM